MPCYWYSESLKHEIYYVDEQTCDYQQFSIDYRNIDNIKEKWYKIMLYKPNDLIIKNSDDIKKCKWLVNDSYTNYINNIDNDDNDYEKYEWDFVNHCIKKD